MIVKLKQVKSFEITIPEENQSLILEAYRVEKNNRAILQDVYYAIAYQADKLCFAEGVDPFANIILDPVDWLPIHISLEELGVEVFLEGNYNEETLI